MLLFQGTDITAIVPSQAVCYCTSTQARTCLRNSPLTSSHSTLYETDAGSVKLSLHLRHRFCTHIPKPVLQWPTLKCLCQQSVFDVLGVRLCCLTQVNSDSVCYLVPPLFFYGSKSVASDFEKKKPLNSKHWTFMHWFNGYGFFASEFNS
jgi:hypothetical protein